MRGYLYDLADTERWADEPAGADAQRGAFQRDRARVLHSAALRRLAGKTQVVTPGESDFPRTRLTHSLECAQIGRELGHVLGADPDVVDAACLAHDLGHPPFGHTGEHALNIVADACGGFEGNAQSLRILTRLEAKIARPGTGEPALARSAGLNLTRATLDATIKYPWSAPGSGGKFGVYPDDQPVFAWIRLGAPDGRQSLEAQVMDWADDVAYSVHDLEDAVQAGHLTPALLHDEDERAELFSLARQRYAADADAAELAAALDRLLALACWPDEYDRGFAAQIALKQTTSTLIGRFCRAATIATLAGRDPTIAPGLGRYSGDLVVPRATRHECAVLKAVAARYVMDRPDARRLRARQRSLITELVSGLRERPDLMEPSHLAAHQAAPNDEARLRAVVDQVAALTDASAVAMHRRVVKHD
jgi:dGTPase